MAKGRRRLRLGFRLPPLSSMQFVRRFQLPAPVLDPGNDPKFRSSLALRLTRRLPVVFANSPERVVLNAVFVLTGLAGFFSAKPDSILYSWPPWVLVAWAMCMAGGGASVLLGMFRNLTSVERLGYVLVSPACLIYAVTAVVVRGLPGIPVFLTFAGLACAKLVRLLISSGERDMTIEYGQRMDRELRQVRDESRERLGDS